MFALRSWATVSMSAARLGVLVEGRYFFSPFYCGGVCVISEFLFLSTFLAFLQITFDWKAVLSNAGDDGWKRA